jgi:hypothetical protein
VDAGMEREYYTRHGLHLNGKGKKIMAKKISSVIQEIIGLQTKNAIIPLTWKNTFQEHIKQYTEAKNVIKTIQKHMHVQWKGWKKRRNYVTILDQGREQSNRKKTRPPTRNEYFLWE